jgi:ribosomal protein S18 acetylase RimI-like enzyme
MSLAVDPTANVPGVGEALTRALADIFRERGRAYMDLSVAHDNVAAIALYEKLGFQRVPVLAVKRKNAINEPLFTHPPETVDDLNPYARISPTKRCAAASRSRYSTRGPERCVSPTAGAAWSPGSRCPSSHPLWL